MNIQKEKEKLKNFLDGRSLNFTVTHYSDGEWVAECNEIPAIITGGMSGDITKIDYMMREAILTAANIDIELSEQLLSFKNIGSAGFLVNILGSQDKKKAEYALA